MKDAERIYALYVQANPVPNPDLLPLTGDEAALLTIERSQDMITHEPVEKGPSPRATMRKRLVAVGAFAAVIVVGLLTVLLVNNDESGPVAATDATPAVTFDGTTCTYDGPTLIEEGTIEFSMTNSADVDFTLAGWLIEGEALEAELQRTPIGTDMGAPSSAPMPDGGLVMGAVTSAGDSRTGAWPLTAGTYLIDCKTVDHVWRSAQVDVVAP